MVQFTPDLITHVDTIDDQHREIFKRVNEIALMGNNVFTDDKVMATLDFLASYVVEHFMAEEILMIECRDPNYEFHRSEHTNFINYYKKTRDEFNKIGSSVTYMLGLIEYIVSWILNHITVTDKQMAQHVRERRLVS